MKNSLLLLFITIVFLLYLANVPLIGQSTLSNPSACGLGLPITDNSCPENGVYYNPDEFEILVNNAPGTILGVDVFLSEVQLLILHEWTGDLNISLTSPGGITVDITSNNGGGDDNYGNPYLADCTGATVFSASSCFPVEESGAPFTAHHYLPEESFYRFNDGITDPNGIWTLTICDDVEEDIGFLEYVNLVFEPFSCQPALDIEIINVDTTTVVFDWDDMGMSDCGTTIIEYGHPGFPPGTGFFAGGGTVVLENSCPPFEVTGLLPDTHYDFYIRKFCSSSGATSENSCVYSTQTGCQPAPVTLEETYDEQSECSNNCGSPCSIEGIWTNSGTDDFDWLVHRDSTSTDGTGPSGDVNGDGNYIYMEGSGSFCSTGDRAELLSNCLLFDKQGSDTCHLSFNYHMFGSQIGMLELHVSTDGGFSWEPIWGRHGNQGNKWHKEYLSLANFEDGSVLQFRFVGVKGFGPRSDVALDHIVFYGSQDLGAPANVFYRDFDGDTYGNADEYVSTCFATPPTGYVSNGDDCDDTDAEINPGMPEIPCDFIDNNCNGDEIDDDTILPPPMVINDTICSGEQARICAFPEDDRHIIWYASSEESNYLFFGSCFEPDLPENHGLLPQVYHFFAEETNFYCHSEIRAEATIVVNPLPDLSSPDMPQVCPGDTFNLLSLTIEDDHFTGGDISFHEASPASQENELPSHLVSPDSTRNYYYKMTTSAACSDEEAINIEVKPGPELSFLPADSFALCLENKDTIEVFASGGTGAYTFFWDDGSDSNFLAIEGAYVPGTRDVYGISVTDEEGCTTVDSVIVVTTNSIDSIRLVIDHVSDCMGEDGLLTVTPLNGQAPFNFAWEGSTGISGDTTNVPGVMEISGLQQGAYQLTITDSSLEQCDFVLRNVLVNGPDAVVEDIDITHVSCNGIDDGSICLTVDGTAPSYLWSNGDTTACIENLLAGSYSVTITDGVCQTVLPEIVVEEPEAMKVSLFFYKPSCHNSTDGSMGLNIFGGTRPYDFEWNTGSEEQSIFNLGEGTYAYTITDTHGCTYSDDWVLTAPDSLELIVESLNQISCKGFDDGSIRVSGRGGTGPYSYNWSNSSASSAIGGLIPGNYSVTVDDFNNCQTNLSFQIEEPDSLQLQLINTIEPDCVGDFSGVLDVSATGGTLPYQYTWEDQSADSIRQNIGVGLYSVVVSDARACISDTLEIELSAVSILNLQIDVSPPLCMGSTAGSINLLPNGTPPFSYQWATNPEDTTASLTAIGVGHYPLTIIDGQGCIYDTAVTISAPQVFVAQLNGNDPSCFGVTDGLIDVLFLETGTPPYNFSWSNGDTSSSIYGLEAGAYVMAVTDVNDCLFISDTVYLEEPSRMKLRTDSIGNILCYGENSGFIEQSVEGGVPPYNFTWFGLNTAEEDVYDIPAGDYHLIIRDRNDCPIDTNYMLSQPDSLDLNVEFLLGNTCDPADLDTLLAYATGGTPLYTFSWSDGTDGNVLSNPDPGDYQSYVADENGCLDSLTSIKVRDRIKPLILDTFYLEPFSCYGVDDASMTALTSGGSGNLLYHFTPTHIFQTAADSVSCLNLPLSTGYSVTITDLDTGCKVESETFDAAYPDPLFIMKDTVQSVSCFGIANGAILIDVIGGTPPFAYSWFDTLGIKIDSTKDLSGALNGNYKVEVVDARGCFDSLWFTIPYANEVISLSDSLTIIEHVLCRGDSTGGIYPWVLGGSPPFTFRWSYMDMEVPDLIGVPAGTYEVTITDADTCRAIIPNLRVLEPAEGMELEETISHVSCFGESDAYISMQVDGGGAPYEFSWQKDDIILVDAIEDSLGQLSAGNYLFIVEDTNACIKKIPIRITQPDILSVEFDVMPPDPPEEEGRVEAIVSGGTPPYAYQWNTGSADTLSVLENLTDLFYQVTITDANECMLTDSVTIVSIQNPEVWDYVHFYPNPAREKVQVDISLKYGVEQFNIEMVNLLGQPIDHYTKSNFQKGSFSMNISKFPADTYLIYLNLDGKRFFAGKLIKL